MKLHTDVEIGMFASANGLVLPTRRGRSGARFAVRPIPRTSARQTFACVASAYTNALIELGFPAGAVDAQRIHTDGREWDDRGQWRSLAGDRILDAVHARGYPIGMRVFQRIPRTVGGCARMLRGNRMLVGVISIKRPLHAVVLVARRGERPLIIDNGGWDERKQLGWWGLNVDAVVGMWRTDAPGADCSFWDWTFALLARLSGSG